MTALGLLKSGELRVRRTIDQGNLMKTSMRVVRKVPPHHGETLLDGTAQPVRNEEPLRDRSGQPDFNSQEEANSQNFIMGSDATEFVNRVNDEVRKRPEKMSNVAGEGEEHSIILGMFMAVTMNCSDVHGEEFPKQSEFHYQYIRSHIEENVRHISKTGKRTR